VSGVLDVLTAVLVITASSLTLLAAIGLQRFDSVFARIHPATKAITLGVVAVAVGAALQADAAADAVKLLLVAVLQLVTSPIASHMVARAAYRAGTELNPQMQVDELAPTEAGQRGAVVRPRGTPPRSSRPGSSRPDERPAP
jgi:multicomponent Na+:H+ antiporter subunit G